MDSFTTLLSYCKSGDVASIAVSGIILNVRDKGLMMA